MMNGSTWRWTLWSTRLAGSKPYSWSAGLTSQAMRHFWSLASNRVIGPAPLLLARMFFQLVSTSPPSGVTRPRPVTTTRRIAHSMLVPKQTASRLVREAVLPRLRRNVAAEGARSALVLVDIVDRVLDRRDLLRGVVGNLDPELLLESHHQLDDVEAVGAEVVDEAGFLGDLLRVDAEMLDDDLLHPIGSLAHDLHSSICFCAALAMPPARGKWAASRGLVPTPGRLKSLQPCVVPAH